MIPPQEKPCSSNPAGKILIIILKHRGYLQVYPEVPDGKELGFRYFVEEIDDNLKSSEIVKASLAECGIGINIKCCCHQRSFGMPRTLIQFFKEIMT